MYQCVIAPAQVWLGNIHAARDLQTLLQVGITHVLNCAALQCPSYYPQVDLLYLSSFVCLLHSVGREPLPH